jgi:hypothetical protein
MLARPKDYSMLTEIRLKGLHEYLIFLVLENGLAINSLPLLSD